MQHPLIPRRLVLTLLVAAVLLPIALCVILGVAALLVQMGDAAGGAVLHRTALAGGILWSIDLICLVLAMAIDTLGGSGGADGE